MSMYGDKICTMGRRSACLLPALLLAACSTRRSLQSGSKPPGTQLRLPAELRESLLVRSLLVVNAPYRGGGNTPERGFDCSGLVQWAVGGIVQKQALPRTTAQWAGASRALKKSALQRGDFVFFNTSGARWSHMGIFVGNGQFVHAPSSGGIVRRVRLDDNPYFAKRFSGARSIFIA